MSYPVPEAVSIDDRHSKRVPRILLYSSCVAEQVGKYLREYPPVADHFAVDVLQIHKLESAGVTNLHGFRDLFGAADFIFTNKFSTRWQSLDIASVTEFATRAQTIKTWVPPNFRAFWPAVQYDVEVGVDAMLKEECTVDDILFLFKTKQFDPLFEAMWNDQITRLKALEAGRDIQLSEFVERNHRAVKLWFTSNHPTWHIIAWIGSRICSLLGVEAETEAQCLAHRHDYSGTWNVWPETFYEFDFYKFEYPMRYRTTAQWGGLEWYWKQITEICKARKT